MNNSLPLNPQGEYSQLPEKVLNVQSFKPTTCCIRKYEKGSYMAMTITRIVANDTSEIIKN